MSQQLQFVIDIEVEDDEIDVTDVDVLNVDLDFPGHGGEHVEFSFAAHRVDG